MIEAVLNGRLGNWLFQYAAARSLALDRGTGVVLDASRHTSWRRPRAGHVVRALRFFRLEATFERRSRRSAAIFEYRENGWGYDPRFHELGIDARLVGYFQSARYWQEHSAQIRADLAPARLPNDREFLRLLDEIESSTALALHVRRGDYVTEERDLHFVCGDEYYDRALRYVRERVEGAKLFVFSDEPAWCRRRFGREGRVVDLAAARNESALDLYLMSRCTHHVVSNSTYSWWGAWLAAHPGQVVCTPERWFNDSAMSAAAMRDTVPAGWRRIACEPQAA